MNLKCHAKNQSKVLQLSMGDKDIISKEIFQRLVRDFATYLFRLSVTDVEMLDTEQHRIEDRRADLVARVTAADGEVFLLHIEIQNHNDSLMPKRMLRRNWKC